MSSAEVPDDVPVADAVEQQREAAEPVLDNEVPGFGTGGPPLEASPADWQEQSEAADPDAELDDFERET